MLYKTRGIALSYIRYRESSVIAKIYTEVFGIQSYIVSGVRSSKSKTNKIALFQPLTLLDLVVYHKSRENALHRISEMRVLQPFSSVQADISKIPLGIFIAEVLGKTLREEEANEAVFGFLVNSLQQLDELREGLGVFHIQFLSGFAFFLGFGLSGAADLVAQLKENHYMPLPDSRKTAALDALIAADYGAKISLSRGERLEMLGQMLFFYRLHLDNFGEIKSVEILREIMK